VSVAQRALSIFDSGRLSAHQSLTWLFQKKIYWQDAGLSDPFCVLFGSHWPPENRNSAIKKRATQMNE